MTSGIFQVTEKQAGRWLAFILLLSALIRLPGIGAPLADDQSWNQTSAATVARHFVDDGIDFFHTQWDVLNQGSNEPRIEVEEAPIFHTLVALGSKAGVPFVLWGRLINIAIATLAGWFFYQLVLRKTDYLTALIATVFFVFAPYAVFFFRTFMSDPAMIMAIIAGLYYYDRYLETESYSDLLASAAMVCLAGLFKPFALHVGVPILILTAGKYRFGLFARPSLYLYGVLAVAPTLLWVLWAAKVGTLGGVTDSQSVTQAPHLWGRLALLWDPHWYYRLQWRLFDRMATPIVSVLMAATLFIPSARRRSRFFFIWLAGVAFYIATIRSGNEGHNYYQLPATAPFAAIAAIGFTGILSKIKSSAQKPVLIGMLLLFAVVAVIYTLPHYKQDLSSVIAGELAKKHTVSGETILVCDPGSTRKNQVIFNAHRQGWHFQALKPAHIQQYKELGAKAVVLVLEPSQTKMAASAIAYLDANYFLVAEATGDYNLRSRRPFHTIRVYRFDGAK
jgi:4-amino-4-deoxy-L-arabinose transferase-like glycosyltransferase